MKLTKPQTRALRILCDHGPLRPGQFARRMWPDSPGWRRTRMMPMCGGAYLAKLGYRGWARPQSTWSLRDGARYSGHVLTPKGRELANDFRPKEDSCQ